MDSLQAQAQAVLDSVEHDARAGAHSRIDRLVVTDDAEEETIGGFTREEIDEMFSYG
jgi:hypothetical protein